MSEFRKRLTAEENNLIIEHRSKNPVRNKVSSNTSTKDYGAVKVVMTAWNKQSESMMGIDEYCKFYNLEREDITSWKLVSHTGVPFYNIVFKEKLNGDLGIDLDHIRSVLNAEFKRSYTYIKKPSKMQKEGVLKWADLHFGAHIENLVLSDDYNKDILLDGLLSSVEDMNALGFTKSHIHINGDLIESFSGLNHINSWMSMDKNLVGQMR